MKPNLRARVVLFAALGAIALPARAQLGSFNQPPVQPALVPAEITAPVALMDVDLPLEVQNAETTFPATFSKLFNSLFLAIPDNSAVGVTHAPVVSGVPGVIQSLQVNLTISARTAEPMFNGDLFVTLSHDSGFAVLLNRVGRRDGSTLGYGDNGFSITLSDLAATDIHAYRTTVTGNELTPISTANPAAPLTGTWQPDGRTADPGTVLTSSPRITSLGSFAGLDPNGEWTLFLSDLSGGGLAQLESWSMEFTVVPEPETVAILSALSLGVFAAWRRLGRNASPGAS